MASYSLYSPIVESYYPAFIVDNNGQGTCKISFSLSKFSTTTENVRSIHILVANQITGKGVVAESDSGIGNKYRTNNMIIINQTLENTSSRYTVELDEKDIFGSKWDPNIIYKIQIRLSLTEYDGSPWNSWYSANSNKCSEWSTIALTKPIYRPIIEIPVFNYSSQDYIENENIHTTISIFSTTLHVEGDFDAKGENLYSYQVNLTDDLGRNIEGCKSEILYPETDNKFEYTFPVNLDISTPYIFVLSYMTKNKYENTISIPFSVGISTGGITDAMLEILDFSQEENEDAYIKINIKNASKGNNYCIRRTDNKSNYKIWTDIKTLTGDIQDAIYDFTIENQVSYKYGIQILDSDENRGNLNIYPIEDNVGIVRIFEAAYLLGEGGRQLKLRFDNTMNNYSYTKLDSKMDTIGSKYPFIVRSGKADYRTFPINGLISFNMDDQGFFIKDNFEILDCYDYKKEFDFREEVLKFLQDGKPKLFKSGTEGNILIRLMNVSATPNQTLNRLVYSFTSNAFEIGEANIKNYSLYGLITTGSYTTPETFLTQHIGQLNDNTFLGEVFTKKDNDIIKHIANKYNQLAEDAVDSYIYTIKDIYGITVEFVSDPYKINIGRDKVGYLMRLNGKDIMVDPNYSRIYHFDANRLFTLDDKLEIICDDNVIAIVNFCYDLEKKFYEEVIPMQVSSKNIGQFYGTVYKNYDIFNEIFYKYYYSVNGQTRLLNVLNKVIIQADPGSRFKINGLELIINETGLLDLSDILEINEIIYEPIVEGEKISNDNINQNRQDIIIDYFYTTNTTIVKHL